MELCMLEVHLVDIADGLELDSKSIVKKNL